MDADADNKIAGQLAQLHGDWYGRGPSSAKAFVTDEVVVVVLEETFSPAEQKLVERNQADGIRDMRRRFQTVMAEEFESIVEQATGRQVRSFISDTDLQENVSIEVFLLGGVRENMSGFESTSDYQGTEND